MLKLLHYKIVLFMMKVILVQLLKIKVVELFIIKIYNGLNILELVIL